MKDGVELAVEPEFARHCLGWKLSAPCAGFAGGLDGFFDVVDSNLLISMVGAVGFEPTTSTV